MANHRRFHKQPKALNRHLSQVHESTREQIFLWVFHTSRFRKASAQTIITFLGTAAANAFPEAFCSCRNCTQARTAGGRSLRKRSAALINDDLLIDLGPDIMASSQIHSRPLHQVRCGKAAQFQCSSDPAFGTVQSGPVCSDGCSGQPCTGDGGNAVCD